MKKLLLLFVSLMLTLPILRAQDPTIHIHTCVAMQDIMKALSPSDADTDPVFSYDSATGNYTYEVIGWPQQSGSSAYNAKVFYSVSGDEITYYGITGSFAMLNFTTKDTYSYTTLTSGTTITSVKGAVLSNSGSSETYCDVRITMNLEEGTIEFTKFEGGQEIEIPTLESIEPQNGSTVTPEEDGSVKIVLTFSGEVNKIQALVDGTDINASEWGPDEDSKAPTGWENNISSSDGGTVWTLIVPQELVSKGLTEDGGKLTVDIQALTKEGYNVSFDDSGSIKLVLNYLVSGQSPTTTLNFTGETSVLTVYESIAKLDEDVQYLQGVGALSIQNNTLECPVDQIHRFLFVVPAGYVVNVSSDLAQSANTWQTGTLWTQKKYVDEENTDDSSAEVIFYNVNEGTSLNVFTGAIGKSITINVTGSASEEMNLNGSIDSESINLALSQDEDESNQYTGYINITDGSLGFNISYGNKYLVPGTGKNTEIKFDEEGNFSGPLAEGFNNDSNGALKWTVPSWTAGELGVLVDLEAMTITFSYNESQPDENFYLRSSGNNYNPAGNLDWALIPSDPDANGVYKGEFTIQEKEFSFNILGLNGIIIIPSELESTEISFDNKIYAGQFDTAQVEGDDEFYWTYPNWMGGKVLVTLDTNESTITIEDMNPAREIFISGAFNNNATSGKDWQLAQSDDDPNVYVGYYEVPAGELSFNFYDAINNGEYLVPGGENVDLEFVDGSFQGEFVSGESSVVWSNTELKAGELGVSLDLYSQKLTLTFNESPDMNFYISGDFNKFDPAGNAIYALTPDEYNEVYSGEFEIEAGQFSFNIVGPYDMVYVPATFDEDENPVAEDADVVFTDKIFTGFVYSAYNDDDEAEFTWSCAGWQGGKIEVSLDIAGGGITITNIDGKVVEGSDGISGLYQISENDAVYNLQGVKVSSSNLRPGLYIINGKKVLVK